MPEIASVDEARRRLSAIYKWPDNKPELLDDYARVAHFLSDSAAFERALNSVSEQLWIMYTRVGRNTRNRFTTAIGELGRQHGFLYDESKKCATNVVVLLGAVDGGAYLNWVREGIFFKDDMDAKHGEHSHTLQWLAIALARKHHGLQIHSSAAHLYKNIYDIKEAAKQSVIVPGFKMKPKQNEQAARKGISLWSWLVDCFPTSNAKGGTLPEAESLFSDSYRCPQHLMKYLFDSAGDEHFVATYLRYRYLRRRWLQDSGGKYGNLSGGGTTKSYMSNKLERSSKAPESRLSAVVDERKQPVAYVRAVEDKRTIVKQTSSDSDLEARMGRRFVQVKLHGIKGELRDPSQSA